MTTVKPNLVRFFKLIADGNILDAQKFVDQDSAAIVEEKKREYESAQADHTLMRTVLSGALTQGSYETFEAPELNEPVDQRARIVALAEDLATTGPGGGRVTVDEVVAAMAKQGIVLKSTRPATSVANILFNHKDWTRHSPGVFIYKNN